MTAGSTNPGKGALAPIAAGFLRWKGTAHTMRSDKGAVAERRGIGLRSARRTLPDKTARRAAAGRGADSWATSPETSCDHFSAVF
jgi:hypothetical protein